MKILIAEDEPMILSQYKSVLEHKGHKVTLTENGKVCADEFAANPDFDCVVLDYKMPVMDGFEAAKSILNVNPKQRIIFASAYLDETIEKQIQKLKRITEIIKKPFKINDMVTVLESTEMHTMVEKFNMNISKKDGNITHDEMIDIMSDIKNITEEN